MQLAAKLHQSDASYIFQASFLHHINFKRENHEQGNNHAKR